MRQAWRSSRASISNLFAVCRYGCGNLVGPPAASMCPQAVHAGGTFCFHAGTRSGSSWVDVLLDRTYNSPDPNAAKDDAAYALYISKNGLWPQEAPMFLKLVAKLEARLDTLGMDDVCALARACGFAFNHTLRHTPLATEGQAQQSLTSLANLALVARFGHAFSEFAAQPGGPFAQPLMERVDVQMEHAASLISHPSNLLGRPGGELRTDAPSSSVDLMRAGGSSDGDASKHVRNVMRAIRAALLDRTLDGQLAIHLDGSATRALRDSHRLIATFQQALAWSPFSQLTALLDHAADAARSRRESDAVARGFDRSVGVGDSRRKGSAFDEARGCFRAHGAKAAMSDDLAWVGVALNRSEALLTHVNRAKAIALNWAGGTADERVAPALVEEHSRLFDELEGAAIRFCTLLATAQAEVLQLWVGSVEQHMLWHQAAGGPGREDVRANLPRKVVRAVASSCRALDRRLLEELRARYSLHQMRADVWVAAARLAAFERYAAALRSDGRWSGRAATLAEERTVFFEAKSRGYSEERQEFVVMADVNRVVYLQLAALHACMDVQDLAHAKGIVWDVAPPSTRLALAANDHSVQPSALDAAPQPSPAEQAIAEAFTKHLTASWERSALPEPVLKTLHLKKPLELFTYTLKIRPDERVVTHLLETWGLAPTVGAAGGDPARHSGGSPPAQAAGASSLSGPPQPAVPGVDVEPEAVLLACRRFVLQALREAVRRSGEMTDIVQARCMLEGCVASKVRDELLLTELVDVLQELFTRRPDPEILEPLCRLVRQTTLQHCHPFLASYCE